MFCVCSAELEGVPGVYEFLGEACTCPWVDDGEHDEPEGTGICPEGTDPGEC